MSQQSNPYQSPAVVADDPGADPAATELGGPPVGFQSARTWGIVACVGLSINLVASLTLLGILIGQLFFPSLAEDAYRRSWLEPLYMALFSAMNSSRFATAIPFLGWEYRAYRNLTALGHQKLQAKYAWVVVCWFVPIMNWFCPHQVMDELYQRSHSDCDSSAELATSPMSVNIWWGAWLVAAFIGLWQRFLLGPAETAAAMWLDYGLNVAYLLAAIVSAILAIYLVTAIDRFQVVRMKNRFGSAASAN
jgi:hypothetical protein